MAVSKHTGTGEGMKWPEMKNVIETGQMVH